MAADYRYLARSRAAFVAQIVRSISGGYYFYICCQVPAGKAPEAVDEKLLAKYDVRQHRLSLLTLAGDWVYEVHSWFHSLTRAQFDYFHYAAIAVYKVTIFTAFLFPYLAIRIVLWRDKSAT